MLVKVSDNTYLELRSVEAVERRTDGMGSILSINGRGYLSDMRYELAAEAVNKSKLEPIPTTSDSKWVG